MIGWGEGLKSQIENAGERGMGREWWSGGWVDLNRRLKTNGRKGLGEGG